MLKMQEIRLIEWKVKVFTQQGHGIKSWGTFIEKGC